MVRKFGCLVYTYISNKSLFPRLILGTQVQSFICVGETARGGGGSNRFSWLTSRSLPSARRGWALLKASSQRLANIQAQEGEEGGPGGIQNFDEPKPDLLVFSFSHFFLFFFFFFFFLLLFTSSSGKNIRFRHYWQITFSRFIEMIGENFFFLKKKFKAANDLI